MPHLCTPADPSRIPDGPDPARLVRHRWGVLLVPAMECPRPAALGRCARRCLTRRGAVPWDDQAAFVLLIPRARRRYHLVRERAGRHCEAVV